MYRFFLEATVWSQNLHRIDYFCNHINKFGRFRRGNPRKVKTAGLDTDVL